LALLTVSCGFQAVGPILKSKKALGEMQTGQTLLVLATDGGAWDDFDYFCANTGHRLIERREDNGIYWFFIARG
jgi:TusA-related sulfurtransferase